MMWIDIASIVFACVTAIHLGLVKAVKKVIRIDLPIIGCVKCLTFWVTNAYFLWHAEPSIVRMLAVSFLASYLAIWLELIEGYIDTLYVKVYEKIYSNTEDDTTSNTETDDDSAGSVSEL